MDEYDETTIDDDEDPWAICEGDDCRTPRVGPFVVYSHDGLTYCLKCFVSDVLRIDPDEYGLV